MDRIRIIHLLIVLFTINCSIECQTEWNLDFEIWDETNTTPELWHDTTIVENRTGLFPPNWHYDLENIPEGTGLGRTTDATKGNFAVALSGFYSYEKMRIISGKDPNNPGWPIDFKPSNLTGDYKAILLGNCDSLITTIKVQLSAFNINIGESEILAESILKLYESEEYKSFNLDINYVNSLVPDTIIIELSKRRYGFDAPPACLECSHVFFDNLKLNETTSIEIELMNAIKIEVFPNPAKDFIHLEVENTQAKLKYELSNSYGQLIQQRDISNNHEIINLTELQKGIYFVCIRNTANKILVYKKIIKL